MAGPSAAVANCAGPTATKPRSTKPNTHTTPIAWAHCASASVSRPSAPIRHPAAERAARPDAEAATSWRRSAPRGPHGDLAGIEPAPEDEPEKEGQ